VDKDISLGVEIGWLVAAFERFHLREDFTEQAALIEQVKSAESIG
jgi:hypothetical protein